MKKFYLFLILLGMLLLIGCENHKCKNFERRTLVEATCIDYGEEESYCTECGKVQWTKTISKSQHNVSDWVLVKESTCSENGKKQLVCNDCGTIVNEALIEKKDHNESTEKIDKELTCTSNGLNYTECLTCGIRLSEIIIESKGHTSEGWTIVKDATCLDDGEKIKKCTTCKEIYETEVIPFTGHTSEGWTIVKDATCDEEGTEIKKCTICDEIYETEIIPSKGHSSSNWIITIPKTCTTDGLKQKQCTSCEIILEEEIIKASHNVIIDQRIEPTCTNDGLTEGEHCFDCNEVFTKQITINKLPHEIIINDAVEPTCTKSGLTEGKQCKNCSFVEIYQETIEELGHSYEIQTNSCSRCNEKEHMEIKTYDDWTKGVGEKAYVVWLSYLGFETSKYYWQTIPETTEYVRFIGNPLQEYQLNIIIGSRNRDITIEFVNTNLRSYQNHTIYCDSVIDVNLNFYGEKCSLIPTKAQNGKNGGLSNDPGYGTKGYSAIFMPHSKVNILTFANQLSIIGGEGGNGGDGGFLGASDTKAKPGSDGGIGISAGEINVFFGGQSSIKNIEIKGGKGGSGGENGGYGGTSYAKNGNDGIDASVNINYIIN